MSRDKNGPKKLSKNAKKSQNVFALLSTVRKLLSEVQGLSTEDGQSEFGFVC